MNGDDREELNRLRYLEKNYETYVGLTCAQRNEWAETARFILLTDTNVHPGCEAHSVCRLVNELSRSDRRYEDFEPPADPVPETEPSPQKPSKQVTVTRWSSGSFETGFAFHCTCGLTQAGFNSLPTAYRRFVEHKSTCGGGSDPLPRQEEKA